MRGAAVAIEPLAGQAQAIIGLPMYCRRCVECVVAGSVARQRQASSAGQAWAKTQALRRVGVHVGTGECGGRQAARCHWRLRQEPGFVCGWCWPHARGDDGNSRLRHACFVFILFVNR
jgi:hypothetical protein